MCIVFYQHNCFYYAFLKFKMLFNVKKIKDIHNNAAFTFVLMYYVVIV